MYAAIDIGGSKTLVASLDDDGVIQQKVRFETPQDYLEFLNKVEETLEQFGDFDFEAAGVGVPGTLDRKHGRVMHLGNLPWKNMPIQADMEDRLGCPVVIENDAKMAALSEAMMVKDEFRRVLYVTVSTGIGYGLVVDKVIDDKIGDAGGANLLVEHKGRLRVWEDFASGRAIVQVFGKMAKDINDEGTWETIARNLSVGLMELIAITQPEVVVFGGSVGHYFDRFNGYLQKELSKYQVPSLTIPVLRTAARPDEAVLYGCYDLAKSRYGGIHGLVMAPGTELDGPDGPVAVAGDEAFDGPSAESTAESNEYVSEVADEQTHVEETPEVPEPAVPLDGVALKGLEKLEELGEKAVEAEEAKEEPAKEEPVDDLMIPPPDDLVGPIDDGDDDGQKTDESEKIFAGAANGAEKNEGGDA
jgi:predicted NBD/HSP70 family sugar kinase